MTCRVIQHYLPPKIKALIVRDIDEYYTIVVNEGLSEVAKKKAVQHEFNHLVEEDFGKENSDKIEAQYLGDAI